MVGDDDLPFLRWSATVGGDSWNDLLADGADHWRCGDGPSVGGRVRATPGSSCSAPAPPAHPRGWSTSTGPPPSSSGSRPTSSAGRPTPACWAPLPLFWTAGLTTALGPTLAGGGCFVLQEIFDAGDALRLLERERVTEPYTLPHQATALAEHPDWDDDRPVVAARGLRQVGVHPPSLASPATRPGTCPSPTACPRRAPASSATAGIRRPRGDEGQHRPSPPRGPAAGRRPRHRRDPRRRPGRRAGPRRTHDARPLRRRHPRREPRSPKDSSAPATSGTSTPRATSTGPAAGPR